MASKCACFFFLPKSKPISNFFISTNSISFYPFIFSSITNAGAASYKNAFIYEAVRLLGPPARFEASKLKVDFMGEEVEKYSSVMPRIYILSHCDFTADLTLTISNIITIDQLQGWYRKDDVVAEWKQLKGKMHLVIHCYVSGPNKFFVDLAAEIRYHIFSKELPLVLQAVQYGDSTLFKEHPELEEAVVWVYFHSSSPKYDCIECWGPLKDASETGNQIRGLLAAKEQDPLEQRKLQSPKSFLQALFTFLL